MAERGGGGSRRSSHSSCSSSRRRRRRLPTATTVTWWGVVAVILVALSSARTSLIDYYNKNNANVDSKFLDGAAATLFLTTSNKHAAEKPSFALAPQQSFGLVRDVSDDAWRRFQGRALTATQYKFPEFPERAFGVPVRWYIKNLRPVLTCPHAKRMGGLDDEGAFWVCEAHRLAQRQQQQDKVHNVSSSSSSSSSPSCLVYSIGYSGAFERDFVEQFGSDCELHIMDPKHHHHDSSLHYNKNNNNHPNVHWHAWGLKSSYEPFVASPRAPDDAAASGSTILHLTLAEMQHRLGHQDRALDILKLDCEGCEWATFRDTTASNATQILWQANGLPSPKEANTWHAAGPLKVSHVLDTLQRAGYAMFAKDHRQVGPRVAFGFVRLHVDFWKRAAAAAQAQQ